MAEDYEYEVRVAPLEVPPAPPDEGGAATAALEVRVREIIEAFSSELRGWEMFSHSVGQIGTRAYVTLLFRRPSGGGGKRRIRFEKPEG